jgi:uncharacterized protein (DUF1501 family)
MPNIITRRSFLKASTTAAFGVGLASLMNVPPFLKRALAEGNIGINGKKLIFVFLRGGNDGVNNIVPILDPSYLNNRAIIGIPKHPNGDAYYQQTGGPATCPGVDPGAPGAAIPLCNGFAAMNPALANLVPLYRSGKLALIHRAGYRSLSRSHFDSEVYWEKATDGVTANNRLVSDGVWYRAIVESGWNRTHALSGVSVQSNMPQSLRGLEPMTNLSSISRYNTLGVYSPVGATNTDRIKLLNAIDAANFQPRPGKDNREMVYNLSVAFRDTLDVFQDPSFQTNAFFDDDGTTSLFPINAASDQAGLGSGAYGFMQNIKSCAQILNSTDAIITGTEIGGWDTHSGQVTAGTPHVGSHATLMRRVAWAYHALWKYFSRYADKATWENTILVTMSEFGRTSAENDSMGTDHAEASVMYVAGGGVSGGVFGCDENPNPKLGGDLNWVRGTTGKTGSLFSADTNVGYLRRSIDYRSVIGEIIRDHLGATQNQLNRIIPAYANPAEALMNGGTVSNTKIMGELGIV